MSKWTPGPWVTLPMKHYIHIHCGVWKICDIFPEAGRGGVGWEAANANALLISLAPPMAEALREMCDAADGLSVRGGALVGIDRVIDRTRDARALLAKLEAEG